MNDKSHGRDLMPQLKPMPVWESLIYFTAVTFLGIIAFYWLRPLLERSGLNQYKAYLLALSSVLLIFIVWAFIAFLLEGNPLTWKAFRTRMRLNPVNIKLLGWSAGLGLVMFLSTIVFSPLIARAIAGGYLPFPDGIPDYINPLKQLSIGQVKGQLISQGVLPWIPITLIINIIGEELLWRGIVFPRQELRHGKMTFVIHALMWGFAHLFQYWLLLPILVGSFALSYTIQRTKNTWVSVIAHIINNGLPFIIMIFVPS